jgi:ketosteroid isomerase-like protein
LRAFYQRWVGEWQEFRPQPVELIDLGDRLVTHGVVRFCGESSGVELTQPYGIVFTLRAGLVVRDQIYWDPEEGLHTAGLVD